MGEKRKKERKEKKKKVSFSLRRNATRKTLARENKVSLRKKISFYLYTQARETHKKKLDEKRGIAAFFTVIASLCRSIFTFSPLNNKHFSAAQLSIEFGSFNSSSSTLMVGCTGNILRGNILKNNFPLKEN